MTTANLATTPPRPRLLLLPRSSGNLTTLIPPYPPSEFLNLQHTWPYMNSGFTHTSIHSFTWYCTLQFCTVDSSFYRLIFPSVNIIVSNFQPLIGIIFFRWGFLIWELIFIYCRPFVLILVIFLCCFFFHYVSAKFHLWPCSGDLLRPRIGNAESCNRIPSNYCLP